MSDIVDKEARSRMMAAVRRQNTKPEIVVREIIQKLGYVCSQHRKDLPGTPDLSIKNGNVVFFVHGCFWHRHNGCQKTSTPKTNRSFWTEKFSRNIQRDRSNILALRRMGWKCHVIWECETKSLLPLTKRLGEILDSSRIPPSTNDTAPQSSAFRKLDEIKIDELCNLDWLKGKRNRDLSSANNALQIADLFCGAGAMTLGALEAARISTLNPKIAFAVDSSPEAIDTYQANFGVHLSHGECGDITKIIDGELGARATAVERKLIERLGNIDLVLAGPPCQGHSDLNNHTRRIDSRNSLYLRAARFVELVKPKFAIIENVRGVTHDKGNVLGITRKLMADLGYSISERVIHAGEIGLAQKRQRHFFLVSRLPFEEILNETLKVGQKKTTLRDAIGDLANEPKIYGDDVFRTPSRLTEANRTRVKYLFENKIYDLPNSERPPCHREKDHSYNSVYGRLKWDTLAPTLTTGFGSMGQGRFIHPSRRRLITPHEAARMQGIPDHFRFPNQLKRTQLQKLIGNAVPPRVVALIIYAMLRSINKNRER